MKRVYITTIVAALLVMAAFGGIFSVWDGADRVDVLKVGFIYKNDESTPYTSNFMLAQDALERALPGRVKVYTRSNVTEEDTMEPLKDLVREGCSIIFTNNNSTLMIDAARMYPDIQFCQGAYATSDDVSDVENYHSFAGEIYQARYASGVVAGMKLRDMIDTHVISAEEALVGFVGSYPISDVMSAYTAFLLGVRSVAPEATMRVRYTGVWNSYNREKSCAKALIDEGCIIIAQHTDTIGPAVACEEASASKKVYHVGYHQDMTDIAPSSSLVSARTDWSVYVIGAVEALLEGKQIEKYVPGTVTHGNDMVAGFDQGWVTLTDLNRQIIAYGTEERLQKTIDALKKGSLEVFKGDYTGVNPDDPGDTVDLKQGYKENETTSWPSFHYVLDDVITVEE